MRLIKKFIRKIFNLYIFFIGSIKILNNYKIIKNSKKIFIHNYGSFANTVLFADMLRITEKKNNFALIIFFEEKRFNNKIHLLFDFPIIYIPVYKEIKFLKIKFFIGEYYPEKFGRFFIFLLKFLNRNFETTKLFWRRISKTYVPNIFSIDKTKEKTYVVKKKLAHYYVSMNSKPFSLPKDIILSIKEKLDKNKKICTIYRRYRPSKKKSTYLRNVPIESYQDTINYLNKNNYQILIFGDFEKNETNKIQNGNLLIDYKNLNVDKDLFDLFAATNCDFLIGCHGGASILYHYIKEKVHIQEPFYGYFQMPYGFNNISNENLSYENRREFLKKYIKERILHKKIFLDDVLLSYDDCKNKIYGELNPHDKFKFKDNSSAEILEFIKKFI